MKMGDIRYFDISYKIKVLNYGYVLDHKDKSKNILREYWKVLAGASGIKLKEEHFGSYGLQFASLILKNFEWMKFNNFNDWKFEGKNTFKNSLVFVYLRWF